MKYALTLIINLYIYSVYCQPADFHSFFTKKQLRFDYTITGNIDSVKILPDEFIKEPHWGGNIKNLIDTFLYGEMCLKVYDSASNKLIYSKGYNTLFNEWLLTKEAANKSVTYNESVIMPFPLNTIRLKILFRDSVNVFHDLFNVSYNPNLTKTRVDSSSQFTGKPVYYSGISENKLDIVLIPSGYNAEDSVLFEEHVKEFKNYFFTWKPYTRHKKDVNIWAVTAFSSDDNPVVECDFNTLNTERYLMPKDYQKVCDAANCVPYDQIVILVNEKKYGGGGIYNYCCVFSAQNEHAEFLFHHEFGHSFACLADEYYSSPVSYVSPFNAQVEPYHPNITTLKQFDKKWQGMVKKNTPIPTPPLKKYINKIGAFEGAAYNAKNFYRPTFKSSMSELIYNKFGPVNEKAIKNKLEFYLDK